MPQEINYDLSEGFTYQLQKIRNFMLLLSNEIEDINYVWTLDDEGDVTLVYYLGQFTKIKVPTMIEGHPVKYIAATCYNYNTNIVSVNIPDGIVSIG